MEKGEKKKNSTLYAPEKKQKRNKIIKVKGKQSYLLKCGLEIDRCLKVVTEAIGLHAGS